MKKWIGWTVLAIFVVAIIVNLVMVIRIPNDIMEITLTQRFNYPPNQWVFAPPATAERRTIVRPSPDLLYSLCCYDISQYPLRLTAAIPDNYWSISGFAMNTDNFFAINDKQAKSNPIEVVLIRKDMTYQDTTGKAHVIVAPTDRGIILIRTVITSKADLPGHTEIQKKATIELVGAPAEEEVVKPPTAGGLSFEAAEYVNTEHSFSIKYPAAWVKGQPVGAQVFTAAATARVPVITVSIREAATFTGALKAGLEESGGSNINIGPEKQTKLADGTEATTAKADWTVKSGYPGETFALGVQKGSKWIVVTITTVAMLVPYDEAKFSEIAHTLQSK
ncbi:MAG: DUF1254 domain-containing protein [Chloroflexi bacterium]|nr:DUF1254 domain-containing protein [Chloroflexota bacterium]